ncbi:uncharacterized protein LOC126656218 [Mercurialis annua]|uniref:uncharacterized protein LOC126656218 n=1 Tax=Mercurialis annua TaxID=3986 RepID=UPI00215F54CB|nr:uncharacterized protein LOC126656218 [Mercurialis annua]
MASLAIVDSLNSISPLLSCSPKTLNSQFVHSNSFLKLKNPTFLPKLKPISRNSRVFAVQSNNFVKVAQTAWKVGKDGIDAGMNLVPNSVPRPIARLAVTVVALSVSLFVLKSVLSTAFFALATMGFVYFVFIALNKDQGPRGGGGGGGGSTNSSEDPLEEARRIMEKYK